MNLNLIDRLNLNPSTRNSLRKICQIESHGSSSMSRVLIDRAFLKHIRNAVDFIDSAWVDINEKRPLDGTEMLVFCYILVQTRRCIVHVIRYSDPDYASSSYVDHVLDLFVIIGEHLGKWYRRDEDWVDSYGLRRALPQPLLMKRLYHVFCGRKRTLNLGYTLRKRPSLHVDEAVEDLANYCPDSDIEE